MKNDKYFKWTYTFCPFSRLNALCGGLRATPIKSLTEWRINILLLIFVFDFIDLVVGISLVLKRKFLKVHC